MEPAARARRPAPTGNGRAVAPRPPATATDLQELIAQACRELEPADRAAVLAVLGREADLLRRGALPARPRGRLREGRPPVSPAARTFLRPIRIALAEIARGPEMSPAGRIALGEYLARAADGVVEPPPHTPAVGSSPPGEEAFR